MNELVKVDPKKHGLDELKAGELTTGLDIVIEERKLLIESYKDVINLEITEDNLSVFKELRLKIVKNRTQGIEKWHKRSKAYFLAGGRFCDEIKNVQSDINTGMETKLMEAEKHFENLEAERLDKLNNERFDLCKPFVADESLILQDLGCMPQSLWDNYLIGLKSSFRAAREEAERVEKARIEAEKAEIERQKAIKIENEKLKKEAKELKAKQEAENLERERLANIESEKLAEIKRKNDLLNKAAESRQILLFDIGVKLDFESCKIMDSSVWSEFYEEKNKAYQSEQNRIAIEKLKAEKKEASDKAEKEKLQNELRIKEENERKQIEQAEALKQAELSKGDTEKVKDLINDLSVLKTKYSFKSAKNVKMYNQVNELLDKVINHINK